MGLQPCQYALPCCHQESDELDEKADAGGNADGTVNLGSTRAQGFGGPKDEKKNRDPDAKAHGELAGKNMKVKLVSLAACPYELDEKADAGGGFGRFRTVFGSPGNRIHPGWSKGPKQHSFREFCIVYLDRSVREFSSVREP